jgi:hypothetical protein
MYVVAAMAHRPMPKMSMPEGSKRRSNALCVSPTKISTGLLTISS